MDSMRYADYANKMTVVFNTLSAINTKGDDAARENAKNEILAALESVHKFMKSYEDETAEFRGECRRRLASTAELLYMSRPTNEGSTISRRLLVKAQSSLQEIMNSAAGVSLQKSTEAMNELENLSGELKNARLSQENEFKSLEERMALLNILDFCNRMKEDMQVVFSDANSKVRDSVKRWSLVRKQSAPRPVVEYVEEYVPSVPNVMAGLPGGNKLVADFNDKVSKVGQDFESVGERMGHSITRLPGVVNSLANKTKRMIGIEDSASSSAAPAAGSLSQSDPRYRNLPASASKPAVRPPHR